MAYYPLMLKNAYSISNRTLCLYFLLGHRTTGIFPDIFPKVVVTNSQKPPKD